MEKFIKGTFMILGLIMALCLTLLFGKLVYEEYLGEPNTHCGYEQSQPMMFASVSDALEAHSYLNSEYECEKIFLSIPPETVEEITADLLNTKSSCTINDISLIFRERYDKQKDKQTTDISSRPDDSGVPLCQSSESSNKSLNVIVHDHGSNLNDCNQV